MEEPNGMIIFKLNEKHKIIILSCTKNEEKQNGILLVNIPEWKDYNENKEDSYEFNDFCKFYSTENFIPHTFCQINEFYFLAGGIDLTYNKGVIKLFEIGSKEKELEINYLEDINLFKSIIGCITKI